MSIPSYVPGKPIEEVARELGLTAIDKLSSNECPTEPFPAVVDAITEAASHVNRYPETSAHRVRLALAKYHDVDPTEVWVGAGSSDVLRSVALSVGGPGTSAVFADPSFILYPITTMICGAEPIAVPLAEGYRHDLEAMRDAIRDDTTIVYVCSPNNPTGGHTSIDDVRSFIDSVPESVLVVVDEAYAEYVTSNDYASMVTEAASRPNVIALRTFSKIYGLAGLRIGFGIANAELIRSAQRTQAPFSVTTLAQVAAVEALKHQDLVAQRLADNAVGRSYLSSELTSRGFTPAPTQANFVYFEPDQPPRDLADALMANGVIVRPLGGGVRVSVGTQAENSRFISALDTVMVS